jgi:glycosyltransferase involved in cell wall biosynthesis
VLSAKAETQPIVLLEAMASHTPFISTNTGCVTELPGGIVVQTETEMADQIRNLMNSPTRRQNLGETGWNACKTTYDWERVISAYDALFLNLVGKGIYGSVSLDVVAKVK